MKGGVDFGKAGGGEAAPTPSHAAHLRDAHPTHAYKLFSQHPPPTTSPSTHNQHPQPLSPFPDTHLLPCPVPPDPNTPPPPRPAQPHNPPPFSPSPLTQRPPHTLSHPSPPHTLSSPHTPFPFNTHLQGVCLQKVDPAGGRASSQQIRSRGIAKGTRLLHRPRLLSWTPKPRPAKPRGAGCSWRA